MDRRGFGAIASSGELAALRRFAELRARLAAELGVEPNPHLQEMFRVQAEQRDVFAAVGVTATCSRDVNEISRTYESPVTRPAMIFTRRYHEIGHQNTPGRCRTVSSQNGALTLPQASS